jgi:hypothetical protein
MRWFAVPAILGIGALIWLMFFRDALGFRRELRVEDRGMQFVGEPNVPESKIKIVTPKHGCIIVTAADLDGTEMTAYARNDCHARIWNWNHWHWREKAADGTIIGQGLESSQPYPTNPGEKAEAKFNIPTDNRTVEIDVYVTGVPDGENYMDE